MSHLAHRPFVGYLVAVVGTAAVAAVRGGVGGGAAGHEAPLLPFVLSVMVAAWYGGMGPGLLATALGAVAGVYLSAHPGGPAPSNDPFSGEWVRLAFFLAVGLVVSSLCDALLAARRQAEAGAGAALAGQRRLEEADRHKDEFLATLAHELRNPLATIRYAADALRSRRMDEAALQRTLGVLDRTTALAQRLVDDLADLTRIRQGKVRLLSEPVEMAEVVRRAVETSRPTIAHHSHRLDVTLPGRPVPVLGDPARLTQVLANLLANSAKYTPDGGHIRVSLAEEAGHAVVRVCDDGVGLPPDKLSVIFDLFTQVEKDLGRSEGGLGIGLSLVRRLVEMHGGTVEAHSDGPGKGCEFVVHLPRLPDWAPAAEPRPAEQPRRACPGGRRVLVVDDDAFIAETFADGLRQAGHEVVTAKDGPKALAAAEAFRPDAVLLDIGLPGMSGYDVARGVRALLSGKRVLLIAITGRGPEDQRVKEAGFDHHLVKPVRVADALKLLPGPGTRKPRPQQADLIA